MKILIRKKILVICILSFCNTLGMAQGEFAGSMKILVGTKYKDSNSINSLKGFEFREGSLLSDINDPESITVSVFQKSTLAIAFFSIMQDSSTHEYTIMDVLEVKNVQPGWQIRTTFCRQNEVENVEIIALVKSSTSEEFLKNVKQAWRFSRDKRKIQLMGIKGVDCVSEGGS